MSSSIFSLAPRSAVLFRLVQPEIKPKSMNFVKQFFCNKKNHLARYTRLTSGVDKTLKFTISTLDLSKKLTNRFDPESSSLPGLSAAYTGFKDARSVLGLFNVFQGSIPGMVASVKTCHKLIKDIREEQEATSLIPASLVTSFEFSPKQAYNEIALGRKQQVTKVVENICSFLGAGTYTVTFGALRPLMLANHYGRFCSSAQMQSVGLSADALMCASHIAGIGSSVCSLMFEQTAYMQARQALTFSSERRENDSAILKEQHRGAVVASSISLVEKLLDLACDILKLVPACVQAVPGEVRAGLGMLIGLLGMYKVWRSS